MSNITNAVINIPPIGRDQRIGSVFSHVFSIMFQTEQTDYNTANEIIWNFKGCTFLHPFFLAALSVLKSRYGNRIKSRNILIESYFNLVYFHAPLVIGDDHDDRIWARYHNKTYLPICQFNPMSEASSRYAQQLVQNTLKVQIGSHLKLHSVLSLLLGELIDNITDHAHSDKGYIFCQYMSRERMLYVFISDTGRTIYSSYASDRRYMDQLTNKESSALSLALSGKSTKNRPDNENRGYGISKSRKLLVDGLNGEFFMLSGGAFFRHDSNNEVLVDLPETVRWDGTVILLKIPTSIPDNLDIYRYIS